MCEAIHTGPTGPTPKSNWQPSWNKCYFTGGQHQVRPGGKTTIGGQSTNYEFRYSAEINGKYEYEIKDISTWAECCVGTILKTI